MVTYGIVSLVSIWLIRKYLRRDDLGPAEVFSSAAFFGLLAVPFFLDPAFENETQAGGASILGGLVAALMLAAYLRSSFGAGDATKANLGPWKCTALSLVGTAVVALPLVTLLRGPIPELGFGVSNWSADYTVWTAIFATEIGLFVGAVSTTGALLKAIYRLISRQSLSAGNTTPHVAA